MISVLVKRPFLLVSLAAVLFAACARGPVTPAALDTRTEACASCRMPVSDVRFAAQVVAPSEVPLFFDDIGCLRDWTSAQTVLAAGAVAFVADHRTGEWVAARNAVYSRVAALETPMSSHLVAHASPSARDADAAASGGVAVDAAELLGGALVAEVRR